MAKKPFKKEEDKKVIVTVTLDKEVLRLLDEYCTERSPEIHIARSPVVNMLLYKALVNKNVHKK